MFTSIINCPACNQGQIVIQPYMLLQGQAFSCPLCAAKLALHHESKPQLGKGLDAFDKLRVQLSQKADQNASTRHE
ncbi:MAG: hypothetical protein D6711_08795 [Chloroflexi bacterium]|nr:MAG: hypothetical protein D6711_08795 [Chloroflexota bacterium]